MENNSNVQYMYLIRTFIPHVNHDCYDAVVSGEKHWVIQQKSQTQLHHNETSRKMLANVNISTDYLLIVEKEEKPKLPIVTNLSHSDINHCAVFWHLINLINSWICYFDQIFTVK